jgi:hypothetical protein
VLDELVFRDRHVAHQSTLWSLDLVIEPLVADLDGEHFGSRASVERILLVVCQL